MSDCSCEYCRERKKHPPKLWRKVIWLAGLVLMCIAAPMPLLGYSFLNAFIVLVVGIVWTLVGTKDGYPRIVVIKQ